MFKKNYKMADIGATEICKFIDGTDVYNSYILDLLKDPAVSRFNYVITTNEYRPDLIAKEVYGNILYLPYLMLSCGAGLSSYKKGTVLTLISKTAIDNIISGL